MKTKFEIGKAYQHHSGMQLFICGMADTILHGTCFIAENGWHRERLAQRNRAAKESKEPMPVGGFHRQGLTPISMSNDAMQNYFEIPKADFIAHNTESEINPPLNAVMDFRRLIPFIRIKKDIEVFGVKIRKGSSITCFNNKELNSFSINTGTSISSNHNTIKCENYGKSLDEFIDRICQLNTGHKSYSEYLEEELNTSDNNN